MNERRRGLGRGLGALIPQEGAERPAPQPRSDAFFARRAVADEDAERGASTSTDVIDLRDEPPVGGSSGGGDRSAHPRGAAGGAGRAASATPGARTAVDDGVELVPVPGASYAELPVGAIRPNPRQPRRDYDDDEMAELVHSVREIGVLQPVVVRPVPAGEGRRVGEAPEVAYELVMGERRWRACTDAGLETIPAIVRETSDDDLLRDALLENLHRSDLNPLEEAAAYQQLLDDFGCTHVDLAARIGRSRPQVSNTIRLLRLPPLVQRRVAAGVLSAGHARALLGLGDGAAMERLAQRVVAEGLSVRATEEIVALGGDGAVAPRGPRRGADRAGRGAFVDLSSRLSDRFETRVQVAMGQRKGKLVVEFASVEDLNRILGALAPDDPGVVDEAPSDVPA